MSVVGRVAKTLVGGSDGERWVVGDGRGMEWLSVGIGSEWGRKGEWIGRFGGATKASEHKILLPCSVM